MSISSITTSVISSLGNNTGSVIPIATKDLIQNQVLVYQYHKEGGKYDAIEKFVEENGTSAVWLGGLPLLKKIADKTVYKALKISPDVDVRKLKEGAADSVEFAAKKLTEQGKQGGEQFKALQNVAANKNLAKGLFVGKFAFATGLTMLALSQLILYKQKSTKAKVEKKIKMEMMEGEKLSNAVNSSDVAKTFKGKLNNNNDDKKAGLSFKGLKPANALSAFMYNPVLNQFLLDIGITGLRTGTSRDGERRDILTKEAFEIAFLYPLAAPIQKGFDFLFGKMFNKDTNLNYNVLASDKFAQTVKDGSIKKDLAEFTKNFDLQKIGKDKELDKKLLNFVYDNPENAVVKFFKDNGDVQTVSKTVGKKFKFFNVKQATDEIDSLAFIDTKALGKSAKKLSKTVQNMDTKGAIGNAEKAAKYIKSAKTAKGLSVISAIIFGIWGMGVLLPKVVLMLRKQETGTTENLAITKMEKEIRHQMAFSGNGMKDYKAKQNENQN